MESLYDKEGNLQTNPKVMAEIMADFLSDIFCDRVTPAEYERGVKKGEEAITRFVSTPSMVKNAIKEMKATK